MVTMDKKLVDKILAFVHMRGSATSTETAEHLKMDKKKVSHIMAKLRLKWRDIESVGMRGQSRVYGVRK